MINLADKPELQKLYDEAVKNESESFFFKGQEILTSYCKYLLEHMTNLENEIIG